MFLTDAATGLSGIVTTQMMSGVLDEILGLLPDRLHRSAEGYFIPSECPAQCLIWHPCPPALSGGFST